VKRQLEASPFRDGDKLAGTPAESIAKIRSSRTSVWSILFYAFPDFPKTGMAEMFIKEVLPAFA